MQDDKKIAETPVTYIARQALCVDFARAWLADEEDIEEYLASLRKALLAEIQSGKRIQL